MTTTQNCAECGTRAEPGQSFCDACGAVLSWTDRGASRTGAAESEREEASVASGGTGAGAAGGSGASGGSGSAGGAGEGSAASSASSGASASSGSSGAASATADAPASSGSSGDGGSGWDAFARPDGGAGLPPTPRHLADHPETVTDPRPDAADTHARDIWARDEASAHAVDETAPTVPVAATTPSPSPSPNPSSPADAEADAMNDRARRLLVPLSDPEPRPAATPTVAPVLPGRPAVQRPQAVRAPGEELGTDGGTPCPWCATRNRPDRHYCTRCAMPMTGHGNVPGRLPWWRRLALFGNRETPWAGDRPRLRRAFDRILTWLTVAIVLTLLTVLAFNIPKGVQATRDHFAKRASVAPDTVSASRSYPGHKPQLAFDKLSNTWWGPGVSESGQGQWIEARFTEPTRLLDLIITPGVSTRPEQLSESALPHRVKATITLADGKTTTRELTLDQGAGGQRRAFRVGEVTAVRFTIESAHQISSKKQVAIAEIEFFGPSSANAT